MERVNIPYIRIPANATQADMDRAYEQGLMRKTALVHGAYYLGRCRNTKVARWNEERQLFFYVRYKFGARYIETIKHPEDNKQFDVFCVVAEGDPLPEELVPDYEFNEPIQHP